MQYEKTQNTDIHEFTKEFNKFIPGANQPEEEIPIAALRVAKWGLKASAERPLRLTPEGRREPGESAGVCCIFVSTHPLCIVTDTIAYHVPGELILVFVEFTGLVKGRSVFCLNSTTCGFN